MFRSLRLGHATNSSSAHSIIFHAAGDPRVREAMPHTEIAEIDEYARDKFHFVGAREKALYALKGTEQVELSNHERLELKRVLAEHGIPDVLEEAAHIEIPIENLADMQFDPFRRGGVAFHEWLDFLLSDQITIIGYNDEGHDPSFDLTMAGVCIDLDSRFTWKKDGPAIIAYEPNHGTKVRWSRAPYEKAETPELVDVKITDYCGYGCAFCYQGSTQEGAHAPLARIEAIFDELAAMKVFEVAIGGGEPAHHPDFAKIIRAANARKLTFNFTAYGLDWLKDDDVLAALKDARGSGVGISVHSSRDIRKVGRTYDALWENEIWCIDVMAQTVIGATPMATIYEMLEECVKEGIPLLLLGFKDTGRGAGYDRSDANDESVRRLLTRAKEASEDRTQSRSFQLSVDTAFLDAYGHILDEMKVPHELRTSPEGRFSMYVDAVEGTCGPSSYCDRSLMAPITNLRAQFAHF